MLITFFLRRYVLSPLNIFRWICIWLLVYYLGIQDNLNFGQVLAYTTILMITGILLMLNDFQNDYLNIKKRITESLSEITYNHHLSSADRQFVLDKLDENFGKRFISARVVNYLIDRALANKRTNKKPD